MRATSPSMLAFGLILMTLACHCYGDCLQVGFYKGKCGKIDIEKFIHNFIKRKIKADPDVVSDLSRLTFHDCFVRGCDASIFLDGPDTEKTAALNLDLGGFDTMDEIKEAVEQVCPGVVSCADILIMGTRSAIELARGPHFEVETGRRDSLVSLKSEADANIPPVTIPITDTMKLFASKGLDKDDVVVLLGAHTAGTAHCHSFKDRLRNFNGTNKPDPRLNKKLLKLLQETCPVKPTKIEGEAFLDQTPDSHFIIDNDYYKQILAHNGTIVIDENLADSPLTRDRVKEFASNNHRFLKQFGPAVAKMSRIGVLTGDQGEIRKSCRVVNSKINNSNVGNYFVRSE